MKIIVAGGAGFIGSHLCKRLLDEGNKVICIDNLITGKMTNILPLFNDDNFRFMEMDIIDLCDNWKYIDQIYHLASPASPIQYMKYSIETIRTNSEGTLRLLDIAKINNAKILLASTSEVYGDPLEHPQKETYFGNVNPIGPRSNYDESKRLAESICFTHHRRYGTIIKVVRIFNVFGKNMQINDGRVISNFIVQALKRDNITIYGDGSQTRSFCYVDDMVEGLITVMNTPDEITGPINLGNPQEITILNIAERIKDLTKSKSKIVFKDLPEDDPCKRKPDISKAMQLGWHPKTDVLEGLIKTISYFKKILKQN